MTIEVFLYIIGAALLPAIGWAVHIAWQHKKTVYLLKKLLEMHERPDAYGFGTGGMKEVIEDNTRAVKALTHYILWLSKHQGHGTPPPPLDD